MPPVTGYNNLTLEVYAAFSTTRILDADDDLAHAQNVNYDSFYPGGLYGIFTCTIIRDPSRSWPFKQGQRLVARNGLKIVWEGVILSPGYLADENTGARILAGVGCWGDGLLSKVGQRKAWADSRIDTGAWPQLNVSQYQQTDINRNGVIRMTPRDGLRWNAADYSSVQYTAPTGHTVKRIKYNYDFREAPVISPAVIFDFNGTATYTDLANAYDGDTTTGVTVTITTAHFVYVGLNKSDLDKIKPGDTALLSVTMGTTKNAVVSTLSAAYWVGNPSGGSFTAIAITDGTATGGKTLAQNGNITFTMPGDWGDTALADTNKTRKYYLRLAVSVNLTASVNINEITFGETQDWYIVLYNNNLTAEIAATKVSATGTGSIDNTLATPSQSVQLLLRSNVQQTPFGNGSIHGEFSSIIVYEDANTITANEVVTDWVSFLSATYNLSADTRQIAANTFSVEPWVTGNSVDYETAAAGLSRVAALGDASASPMAAYLLDSESTPTPTGKPVLAYQPQPALTDYDYVVTLGEGTLQSLSIAQTPIYNDIIVTYTDANGVTQWVTSADNSNLTDATSVAAYGTRQAVLQSGNSTLKASAVAVNLGRRYLAANKDPHFYVNGSIPVTGFILGKYGNPVPTSEVLAGKRLKIANFLNDEVGASGAGLTFIISHTAYDDASETVSIDCGVPDNLAIILARIAAFPGRAPGSVWQ